jgi:hypothetical protein
MDIPRQDFNMILNDRQFDWADKPMSSDERSAKYQGLREGFTAAGDLKSIVMGQPTPSELVVEAAQRYGERSYDRSYDRSHEVEEADIDCHISREAREVAALVAKAYESDPTFEPVVTKVGANHWEVNELKPRRRQGKYEDGIVDDRVVDTTNDKVDVRFQHRENRIIEDAIDPYFPEGALPFESARQSRDPWYGPVPNMERMFGPTFDHKEWYHIDKQGPNMNA